MNLHAPNSGQICGQAPNQTSSMLSGSGLLRQSENSFPSPMQSNNGRRIVSHTETVIFGARKYMLQQILNFLSQRWGNGNQLYHDRATDLVKCLEEALFRSAKTQEEYLNMDTLESRLRVLSKRLMSNGNQLMVNANAYPSIGVMIPTPGFRETENSSSAGTSYVASPLVTLTGSNTIAPLSCNSGSSPPSQKGSFEGAFASGYPQPSRISTKYSGESNTVTSMTVHNMVTQMIPTPGINNVNDKDTKSMANNSIFMKMESSNSMDMFAAVEPSAAPCPMVHNQLVHGQNNHTLLNISQHTGGCSRSTLQQKSYGLSSESPNGGLGVVGKNMPVIHSHGKNSGQLEGDGGGAGVADASGSRNSNEHVTSVGSTIKNQSLDPASTQSSLKRSLSLVANSLSNLSSAQNVTNGEPQSIDQAEHVNPQLQCSFKENYLQHFQQRQLCYESQGRQIAQHEGGQNKQLKDKILLRCDSSIQSQYLSNIVSEEKSGIGTQHHDRGQHSQASWLSQSPEMSNHYQEKSMENHSRATHSDPHNLNSLPAKASEQMQEFLHPQLTTDTSDFTGHCGGIQHNAALCSQSYSKSGDVFHASRAFSLEQNVQEGFHQQISGGDVGKLNNMSLEQSSSGRCDPSRSAEPLKATDNLCRLRKWLLFLKHARKCSGSEGKCFDRRSCAEVQKLWEHMECCNVSQCKYPRCRSSRGLINHHLRCQDGKCPFCIPVKKFVQERKSVARTHLNFGSLSSVNSSSNSNDTAQIEQKSTLIIGTAATETPEDLQPPIKRKKIEHGSQHNILENARPVALVSCVKDCEIEDAHDNDQHHDCISMKSEFTGGNSVDAGCAGHGQSNPGILELKKNSLDASVQSCQGDSNTPNNLAVLGEPQITKTDGEIEQPKMENAASLLENASKSGKSKIKAVSMVELFTIEQVQDHIISLRQWVGQSKAKAERNQTFGHSASEGSCQLCEVEKLIFEPPPIYCTHCGAHIKKNAMYYISGSAETCRCFCIRCYSEARGGVIVVGKLRFPKTEMGKKKNDEETEEGWVQCDKCEGWQHQICALFNGRKNHGGQAEYTCPNCYIAELENGERVPLPHSAVLGAKDLPITNLSDHLEQRLFVKLKQEREERAKLEGKCYDEVPGAEELVVRVVSSVDRKLDVKPGFLEIFQDQNYPSEFLYKSKMILLFQRIEGVEVCLFGMYVQEYGTECQQPNHRRVYLSYLDSVKYFRPEIKALTGEALRTFVYHEILIGYLEYCKKRGFTSCHIWTCPPLKGEDYILYCHPEIQKTPKSDKLREWYLAMLRKAVKEDVVVDLTNLCDHFFYSNGERKAKVTAARLPYFDGDYWPGAAEDIICQLQQKDGGSEMPKKGAIRKGINKRALRASRQTDLSCNASKDVVLMQKLRETISRLREDFIMVHLQHACTHCCLLMVSGNRWVCQQCKNFQLCDKCYDAEQLRKESERHPSNQKDKHALDPVQITDVPDDTKDTEIFESEFFDTRQAFLSLCQGNHYQYDTLRRAKHSSMMLLYHLHNPTAPAFTTQCAVCHFFIEAGQGWHCETCLDYAVCDACYKKNEAKHHPHMLTNKISNGHDAQNKEVRKSRVQQLRKMLNLLVHASRCSSENCQNLKCPKVKGLFKHGYDCKKRAAGRCPLCLNMWQLVHLHTRACQESQCLVPRCMDLKEHRKRQQQQSDFRRRAAVIGIMRNLSEVSKNP